MSLQILTKLHDYWQRRAAEYYVPDVFGRRLLSAYLTKLNPQSLIEIGCGNGEMFSAYQRIPRVVAVDWSPQMLARANARIARHEYINIATSQLDVTKESYPMTFDVAMTRTCLMHIPPTSADPPEKPIEAACENVAKMSDTLLLMEFYEPRVLEPACMLPKLEWHNWHHDYVGLFEALGYRLAGAFRRGDGIEQTLFHFTRSNKIATK